MSEQPVLTSKESNIEIIVWGDNEEIEQATNAGVDRDLPVSVISKTMTEKLRAGTKPSQQGPVKDSKGKVYTPIGKVNLLWQRSTAAQTNEQTFFVVDLSGLVVIFGANAIPTNSSSNIHTLGLKTQNDEEKKRQAMKKQMEIAKRAKEKKTQENREKQKHAQESSSSKRPGP